MGYLRNILLEIASLDSSPSGFEWACKLATQERARLSLISVLPSFKDLFLSFDVESVKKSLQKDLEAQAQRAIESLELSVSEHGISCSSYVVKGRKTRKLISQVIEYEHDLLIKDRQTDGTTVSSGYGAVDRKLARHCPCPIWFTSKSVPPITTGPVVVATDGILEDSFHKDLNDRLIRYARAIAALSDSPLHVLHSWDFDSSNVLKGRVGSGKYSELMAEARSSTHGKFNRFLEEFHIEPDLNVAHLKEGRPSDVILKYCRSNPVGTLVMGTVGRAGLSGILIGNTAERVMNHLECSLLVVSPKQVRSPLEVDIREGMSSELASA